MKPCETQQHWDQKVVHATAVSSEGPGALQYCIRCVIIISESIKIIISSSLIILKSTGISTVLWPGSLQNFKVIRRLYQAVGWMTFFVFHWRECFKAYFIVVRKNRFSCSSSKHIWNHQYLQLFPIYLRQIKQMSWIALYIVKKSVRNHILKLQNCWFFPNYILHDFTFTWFYSTWLQFWNKQGC